MEEKARWGNIYVTRNPYGQYVKYEVLDYGEELASFDSLLEAEEYAKDLFLSRVVIQREFKDLLTPLADSEHDELLCSIVSEGIREALLFWERGDTYLLIDGHNRFEIAKQYKLDFKVSLLDFEDGKEAKDWIIRNQLGRRNLSKEFISFYRGVLYRQSNLSADEFAQEQGVSKRTIHYDSKFADAVDSLDDSLKKEVLNGKVNVSKKDLVAFADNDAYPTKSKDELQAYQREVSKPTGEKTPICYRTAMMFDSPVVSDLREETPTVGFKIPTKDKKIAYNVGFDWEFRDKVEKGALFMQIVEAFPEFATKKEGKVDFSDSKICYPEKFKEIENRLNAICPGVKLKISFGNRCELHIASKSKKSETISIFYAFEYEVLE